MMSEAKVVETIAAPVAAVWAQLSDFAGIQPGPGIESVEYEGEGVGMVRRIHLPAGVVVERLEELNADTRTFRYAIINDDSPLPFSDYSATVRMSEAQGVTTVDWTGTFEPRGVDEAKAVQIASGIYKGAIQGARKTLAG